MSMMEEALASATDTKACVVGPGAADGAAAMFRTLFPSAEKAVVVEDPRTKAVAGDGVAARLFRPDRASGLDAPTLRRRSSPSSRCASRHTLCPYTSRHRRP